MRRFFLFYHKKYKRFIKKVSKIIQVIDFGWKNVISLHLVALPLMLFLEHIFQWLFDSLLKI